MLDNPTKSVSNQPVPDEEYATIEVILPAIKGWRGTLVQVRTKDNSIKTCAVDAAVENDQIVVGHDVAVKADKIVRICQSSNTFKPPLPDRYCPIDQRSLNYFDPKIVAFLMGGYTQLNHLPSTGLGGFDVEYLPVNKVINDSRQEEVIIKGKLWITVKICAMFADEEDRWKNETEREDWQKEYVKTIRRRWEGCYMFTSHKQDWPILQVGTWINIEWVEEPRQAHFLFKIYKVHGHREEALVHRPKGFPFTPGRVYTDDREPFKFPLFEGADMEPSILYSTDLDQFETNSKAARDGECDILNRMAPTIRFGEGVEVPLTRFLDEQQQETIHHFASIINLMQDLEPDIEYQSATSPRNWQQDASEMAEVRGKAIKELLDKARVESLAQYKDTKSRSHDEQVKLVISKVEILRDKDRNLCDVAGHEFGHILGLGEEYYDAKMKEQNPGYSHHYALVNLAFGPLIANLFTRPIKMQETTAIMSHGKTVRAYHYVTLWEALIRLTEASTFSYQDWRIVVDND